MVGVDDTVVEEQRHDDLLVSCDAAGFLCIFSENNATDADQDFSATDSDCDDRGFPLVFLGAAQVDTGLDFLIEPST